MLELAAIFSDHMVLQKDKRIAVWGDTDEAEVELIFSGETEKKDWDTKNPVFKNPPDKNPDIKPLVAKNSAAEGLAVGNSDAGSFDAQYLNLKDPAVEYSNKGKIIAKVTVRSNKGKFFAQLPPLAAGGPYRLTVIAGKDILTFCDVMVGQVWLAGGQSNMELELQNSFDAETALKNAEQKNVRYYAVPKFAYESDEFFAAQTESAWVLADSESAKTWSAVAYYFAEKVAEKLGETVGIIGCNWGGTSACCWLSAEALQNNKVISSYIEEYEKVIACQDFDEYVKEREDYIAYQTEFEKKVDAYYATAENPTWEEALKLCGKNRYPGPMGPYSEFRPAGLYQMMIKRVCPYTLAGFLYYQGEEDDHKPFSYYELLSALIAQWRTDWGDDKLPFLLVQLPVFQNFGEEDFKNWPLIREAQMRVFDTVKNTGIAVILDNGEYGNIHPTKKEVVGHRLALQAFYLVYHVIKKDEAFGPILRDYHVDGDKMVLDFDGDAIICTADQPNGFELADESLVYVPAEADIQGHCIVLSAKGITRPLYARYCWTNYQPITVFGKNQIPLAPFRTSRQDKSTVFGSRLNSEGVYGNQSTAEK